MLHYTLLWRIHHPDVEAIGQSKLMSTDAAAFESKGDVAFFNPTVICICDACSQPSPKYHMVKAGMQMRTAETSTQCVGRVLYALNNQQGFNP